MDMFLIGTATTKHLPNGAKYFTWEGEHKPVPNKRYICLSKYGVARIDVPSKTFDVGFYPLPTRK
jgi:hypothetical protein